MSKQKNTNKKVIINVTYIKVDKNVNEISVFMNIDYKPGAPLIRLDKGQKEQVGYTWWQKPYRGYGCTEMTEVPPRPVLRIQDNKYKMILKPNDDFLECMEGLAQILVESQGQEMVVRPDDEAIRNISPNLKVIYKSTRLEERLKQL